MWWGAQNQTEGLGCHSAIPVSGGSGPAWVSFGPSLGGCLPSCAPPEGPAWEERGPLWVGGVSLLSTPSRGNARKHRCQVHVFSRVFMTALVGRALSFMNDAILRPTRQRLGLGHRGVTHAQAPPAPPKQCSSVTRSVSGAGPLCGRQGPLGRVCSRVHGGASPSPTHSGGPVLGSCLQRKPLLAPAQQGPLSPALSPSRQEPQSRIGDSRERGSVE